MRILRLVAASWWTFTIVACTANQEAIFRHRSLAQDATLKAGVVVTDGREQADYYWSHDVVDESGNSRRVLDVCRGSPPSVFAMAAKAASGDGGASKGAGDPNLSLAYAYALSESGGQLDKSQFQLSQDAWSQAICPLFASGRIDVSMYHQLLLIQARTLIAEYGAQMIKDAVVGRQSLPFASTVAPSLRDDIAKQDKAKKRADSSTKKADAAKEKLATALGDKKQCSELATSDQPACEKLQKASDAAEKTRQNDEKNLKDAQDAVHTDGQAPSAPTVPGAPKDPKPPSVTVSDASTIHAIDAIHDITMKAMEFDVGTILCLTDATSLTVEQRRTCSDPAAAGVATPTSDPNVRGALIATLTTAKTDGTENRLYIQVGAESQRQPAEALRTSLMRATGKTLGVGHVEVLTTPATLQLRYYGAGALAGAQELKGLLSPSFPNTDIALRDFRPYVARPPSPGLYELWVPAGLAIGNQIRK